MSLVVISMMTIVALGVVFADKGGCPCNPQPPVSKIKEIENTEGDIQPLGRCMRTWIEKDCGPKVYDEGHMVNCWETVNPNIVRVIWDWHWYRYCEKWRVWYDICQHKELYREYLGTFREEGWHQEDCWCSTCHCVCWP